jgi:hypothetical protein
MAQDKGDYPVGYGKPPVHTRFQKGQSGNPSGKPKKILSNAEILTRELDTKVTITDGSKKKRLTKREVIHKAATRMAMKGDLRAIKMVLELDKANSMWLPAHEDEPVLVTLNFPEEEARRQQRLREENPDWEGGAHSDKL